MSHVSGGMGRFFCLLPLMCLSACVSVSKPFYGPGQEGKRLVSNLPPPRLDVPPPKKLFTQKEMALQFAQNLTHALVAQSLPAVTKLPSKEDWWLDVTRVPTESDGLLRYIIVAPGGKIKGHIDGERLPGLIVSQMTADQEKQIVLDAAPRITSLLTGIKAEAMLADPTSLKRRAAKLLFLGVKGAPGDGDIALSRAFVKLLPDRTDQLTAKKQEADFVIDGIVKLSDGPKGMTGHPVQHIEIRWRVRDRAGKEAGAATQLHDIPAGSLDQAWGDVAVAAAQEAAGAVRQIVDGYSERKAQPYTEKPQEK